MKSHWLPASKDVPAPKQNTAMTSTPSSILSPTEVLGLLRVHVRRWLLPAVAITAIAGAYAVFHRAPWEASQALIVRNEASGADRKPGKFIEPEEMKTVQETLLEVVKSRGVLAAALREVGPPAGTVPSETWPTDRDIDSLRRNVTLAPPKGAEFGKTEVFYLTVRADGRARSIALSEAVFRQLSTRSRSLRDARAQSMIDELTKTVRLAKADLDEATVALAATEHRLGSDLAELRSMQETASSDSALRRSSEEIRSQIRENATAEKIQRELLAVVAAAQADPARLADTPDRLLESHASLRRLKNGLIDAQLRSAAMLGTMSAEHPRVLAARETEAEIRRSLDRELVVARQGIEVELRLCGHRRALLEEQLAKTDARLAVLTEVRAAYANQTAELKNRAVLLERAEQNLAEARAAQAGAKAAGLISSIDDADAGIYPVGPGRFAIVLGGVLGGMLAGLGIVFLTVPLPARTEPVASEKTASVPFEGHRPTGSSRGDGARQAAATGRRLTVGQALYKLIDTSCESL